MDIFAYIRDGNLEETKKCVESVAQINQKSMLYGLTPLVYAILLDQWKIFDFLINQKSIDINLPDELGRSPLYLAAEHDKAQAVQALLPLLPKGDVCQKANDGSTPLHAAAKNGSKVTVELIEWMVAHDEPIDLVDNNGHTPLYSAAEMAHPKVVQQLCDAGSEANGVHPQGRPLFAAVRQGNEEIIKILLASGAGPGVLDENGLSPVYWVFKTGKPQLIMPFLEKLRVPRSIQNPLMALQSLDTKQLEALGLAGPDKGLDPLMTLLKAVGSSEESDIQADLQTTDNDGWTALHLAAKNGHVDAIKALLGLGSKVDTLNEDGLAALHLAVDGGHVEAIKALSEGSGNVDVLNGKGESALILAARKGDVASTKTLLVLKANLEIRDGIYQRSALSYAAEESHEEIVALLIEAGCDIYSEHIGNFPPLERAACAANAEVLRLFFDKESENSASERLPRVSAIEEVIYRACNWDMLDPIDWILKEKRYLAATDEKGRTVLSLAALNGHQNVTRALLGNEYLEADTPDKEKRTALSFAAEGGHYDIASLLLDRGANVNSEDVKKRTPLSWAATSASEKTIWLLFNRGAKPDSKDSNDRTPLSWAAESGSEAIVRALLRMEAPQIHHTSNEDGIWQDILENKDKDNFQTPLWYAALGGHIKTTKALLERGANASAKDVNGNDLIDHLTRIETTESLGPTSNLMSQREIRKLLEPYFSLLSKRLRDSDAVDRMFSAMAVWFPRSLDKELEPKRIPVSDLLDNGVTSPSWEARLKWVHLPANNMRWVEILMAKHYEGCGDQDGRRCNLVLRSRLWTDNQHIPQEKTLYHGRFMLPGSHMLPPMINLEPEPTSKKETKEVESAKPLDTEAYSPGQVKNGCEAETFNLSNNINPGPREKGSKSEQSKTKASVGDPELPQKGLVLFMPYLHWEIKPELEKLKKIAREKGDKGLETKSRKGAAKELPAKGSKASDEKLNGTEKLFRMYLDEEHPLHIRRTLDQYYYPDSQQLGKRDEDQTTLRYFYDRRGTHDDDLKPVLTMVDQLWMWVLPKCGSSPSTIITAFPQRSNRGGETKWRTALVNSILTRCGEFPNRSCYEVAEVIAAECSRIYFDLTHNRQELLRFLEIYRTSIAKIMDNDASRFSSFETKIGKIRQAIGLVKPGISEGDEHARKREPPKEVQGESTEAKPTEADSPGIRDLLKSLLDIEEDIEDLRQVKDIQDELNMMASVFRIQEDVTQEMYQNIQEEKVRHEPQNASREQHDQSTSLNYLKAVVKKNLKEVERLDQFAGRAAAAIEQLLELKQKQADLLLTNATYNINEATDKQGKTLMMFTVVTIIFLPVSFMASFLALNVKQFLWGDDKLPLRWVVTVILSVSLPLSAVFLGVAFNLDKSQRHINFGWIPKYLRKVKSVSPPKLALRRNKKEMHVEEGGSRDLGTGGLGLARD